MGRQGPCHHCGATSTPLWRNGPPEKPVLCNACGSRWRTKGTLANYMPLHARPEHDEIEDHTMISKARTIFIKDKEKAKVLKRNFEADTTRKAHPEYYKRVHRKGFDDDATNRSSSGSVMSNTETCAQYGSAGAGDFTEPHVWDSKMPSKKRTCVTRPKQSPVEKLTKDLCTILHDQQSSSWYESSEEDLLFVDSCKPAISVEMGHGSVLIQNPRSKVPCDEDSEASSISTCNKNNNLYSRKDKDDQLEKQQILGHHSSPLCYIDTQNSKGKGIVNDSEVVSTESSFAITTNSSMRIQDTKQQTPSGNVAPLIRDDKEVITIEKNGPSFDNDGFFLCNNGCDGDSEHDLLLDLPYNGSFMEAELLQCFESQSSNKH